MVSHQDDKQNFKNELSSTRQQVEQLKQQLQTQKQIAFAMGIFHGDSTIRTLLESLAEGVIVCDQSGAIVLVNERVRELFGHQLDEVIGQSLDIFLPEYSLPVHAKHIQGFFENPHIRPMGQGVDLTGKRKDGTEFPVEVSLSYLNTEVGILGIAFVTDITKRKLAESDLELRIEELNAFAHTVAHDLKDPLSVLIGFGNLLADMHKTLSESERAEYTMALVKSGLQMNKVIDELLLFSSIRQEDVIHDSLQMDIIVDNIIQRLDHMIKKYKARITLPNSFQSAMGYAPWVEEVWYNYITNAIKYGGSPPIVEIGSELHEDHVKFWIKDNGQGLTQNEQQLLFEPFTQLGSQRFKGHGLGLSIVKKIVEKLNGQVEVKSEVGKGSVFSFYLVKDNSQTSTATRANKSL